MVYHALDRNDPWLNEPFGINRRPMLIDRIDWIDGWPRTRAGRGPSEATAAGAGDRHRARHQRANPATGLRGCPGWTLAGRRRSAEPREPRHPGGNGGSRLDLPTPRGGWDAAWWSSATVGGDWPGPDSRRTRLRGHRPRWSTLGIEVDGRSVLAQRQRGRSGRPVRRGAAYAGRAWTCPPRRCGCAAGTRWSTNLTVRPLARPVRDLVPHAADRAAAGRGRVRLRSAATAGPGCAANPDAEVTGGRLTWPVQGKPTWSAPATTPGCCSVDTPNADAWIAETKLRPGPGRGHGPQLPAGRDDRVRERRRLRPAVLGGDLEHPADRVRPRAGGDARRARPSIGGAIIGTPAPTIWLRLAYTRNAAGEHVYRAGTSRDGRSWTWGAVWTFAAGTGPRIGLIAHGGAEPAVTAEFDYLRFYATRAGQGIDAGAMSRHAPPCSGLAPAGSIGRGWRDDVGCRRPGLT